MSSAEWAHQATAASAALLCAYIGSWVCTRKPPPEWTLEHQVESSIARQAWSFAYMFASSTFAVKCHLLFIVNIAVTVSFVVWGLRMWTLNCHISSLMVHMEAHANAMMNRPRPPPRVRRPPRHRGPISRRQPYSNRHLS
jgi:hypothetical protein